jgi:hypothetical protein|tara:strand:+ start:422 stop:631 length:210 start_codon:yes stop_codon:yes gene_type:complete
MTLFEEADNILQKKELSVKDYNRFVEIGKQLKKPDDKEKYSWLAEGFELRLEEIAVKEGNYNFIKNEEF